MRAARLRARKSHSTHGTHTRGKRGYDMCKRLMVLVLVLGFLFAPAMAYADDGFEGGEGGDFSDRVIFGPNVLDIQSGTYGVQVYAGNKFNAALCVLGFDAYDSRFTNDVKAYLSNESTGGSFYEFSNLFTNNNEPSFVGFDAYNISFQTAIGTSNRLYGAEFVWIARYTDTLRQAAYARVQEVLNGNTGGGSSSPLPDDGTYVTLPLTLYDASPLSYDSNNNKWIYSSSDNGNYAYSLGNDKYYLKQYANTHNVNTASNFSIRMPKTSIQQLVTQLEALGWDDGKIFINLQVNPPNYGIKFYFVHSSTLQRATDSDGYFYGYSIANGTEAYLVYVQTNSFRMPSTWPSTLSDLTNALTFNIGNYSSKRTWTNYPYGLIYDTSQTASIMFDGDGVSGDTPIVPPTQWPDPDPVTPTEPPTVPDPPTTTTPTEPTIPNIGIPQLPNIGLTTEPTYQTADLTAVLDAMAEHCQHLQTCMIECFDSYYSSITQFEKSLQENQKEFLRSWFRVTIDTIRDCFDDLSDYLQRLFTWLADQMDFTFTGGDFDDSSIVWWLKQIYSKLGSGTTVRPTDPVVDPKGIGDWFDQLIKNFVLDLLALGQDFLADVVEMFRQLTTKFPISIPWDILAILTLFAAEPETPVLNIPQYALTGVNTISQVGTYVIDLQDYDGVMSVVRNVEKVVFAFWLCWKIDFFKQAFDIMTGGK